MLIHLVTSCERLSLWLETLKKTCNICLKKIGWGHLKRHMKTHQHGGNTGMIKIDKEAIVKTLIKQQEEFNRKLELGTIINNFMGEN